MNQSLSIILLLAISYCSGSAIAGESDFDTVCNFFTQLQQHANVDKMTPKQRNDFIVMKLNNGLDESNNARVAWESIAYAVAEQRYELYKSAAEEVIKKQWSCVAMQQLANKTGEFE